VSVRRIYIDAPLLADSEVALPPDRSHYARNVLRLRPGDKVSVFDGRGTEIAGEVSRLGRKDSRIRLGQALSVAPESALQVTLIQGISRGEKMDYCIQKCTELGVHQVLPLSCRRSEVRLDAARALKRREHWQGVAAAACEQCGRAWVPEVTELVQIEDLAERLPASLRLYLDPAADQGMRGRLRPELPVVICVGPEGGFEPAEIEQLKAVGFTGLRLGPRILRTETAGPAALAALQSFWGDMG
jgi:16S rRNA (uracil1498-N3)-methyltransferase